MEENNLHDMQLTRKVAESIIFELKHKHGFIHSNAHRQNNQDFEYFAAKKGDISIFIKLSRKEDIELKVYFEPLKKEVGIMTMTAFELRELKIANVMPINITPSQWQNIKQYISNMENNNMFQF